MLRTRRLTETPESPKRTVLFRSGSVFRLQTTDPDVARRVAEWSFAKSTAGGVNCYFRQWIIPRDKAAWVARALGLPMERTPAQLRHDRRMAQLGLGFRFKTGDDGLCHSDFDRERP